MRVEPRHSSTNESGPACLESGADHHDHLASQELSQAGQEHQVEERRLQGTVFIRLELQLFLLVGRIQRDTVLSLVCYI